MLWPYYAATTYPCIVEFASQFMYSQTTDNCSNVYPCPRKPENLMQGFGQIITLLPYRQLFIELDILC